jgi:hypothetical protein
MSGARRSAIATAALVTVAVPVAVAVPLLLWRHTLPADLATHWSGADVANGSTPVAAAVAMTVGFGVLPTWVAVVALDRMRDRVGAAVVVAVAVMFALLWPAMFVLIAAANRGHDGWRDVAGPSSLPVLAVVLGSAAAGAVAGWWATRPGEG